MNLFIHKAIWLLVIFWPPLYNLYGLNTGQILYILVVTSFVSFCAISYRSFKGSRMDNVTIPVLVTLSVSFYFSIVTLINYNLLYIGRDLIEVVRPLLYLIYFLFPVFVPLDEKDLPHLTTFIIHAILLASAIDLLAFFSSFEFLVGMYRPFVFGKFNYHRFSGAFGYPYSYAFVLFFFISYLARPNVSVRYRKILLLIFISFIALGGSRSAIIALFFLGAYHVFERRPSAKKVLLGTIKTVVILTISGALLYYLQIELINKNFEYAKKLLLFSIGADTDYSPIHRLEELQVGLKHMEGLTYLTGIGSAKGYVSVIENIYGHYLVKWGLIGITIYFGHLAALYLMAKPRQRYSDDAKAFLRSFRAWLFVIPIIGFSSTITDGAKLFPVFYLISGYAYHKIYMRSPIAGK